MKEFNQSVDSMDNVRFIAEAAAKAAAAEVANQVTSETRRGFEELETRIDAKLQTYFGDKGPNYHAIQHDRIDRLLTVVDKASVGAVGVVAKYAVIVTVVILALGYLAWFKIQSLFGVGSP
jgi:hypothetical protein